MDYIDVRSDTVTQPTDEMREAMAKAVVGDDVFEDDPTVRDLEELAADMLGKEAGLFVTSGIQGNSVSVMTHTQRGDNILMGRYCHIADHEAGAYAMLAGASAFFPDEDKSVLRPESVEALIRRESAVQVARTGLICLENALSNGNVAPLENMRSIYNIAQENGIPLHLDGARIFNAALTLGADVKKLAACSDTVNVCLSKGLCAPVGSVILGSREFIGRARQIRRILGGGMRQAGVIAAAGIIALTKMTSRLAEDHENAQHLAAQLKTLPGVTVDDDTVKANLVFFHSDWPAEVANAYEQGMLQRGIKATGAEKRPDGWEMRVVTHHGITRKDCDDIIVAMKEVIGA